MKNLLVILGVVVGAVAVIAGIKVATGRKFIEMKPDEEEF